METLKNSTYKLKELASKLWQSKRKQVIIGIIVFICLIILVVLLNSLREFVPAELSAYGQDGEISNAYTDKGQLEKKIDFSSLTRYEYAYKNKAIGHTTVRKASNKLPTGVIGLADSGNDGVLTKVYLNKYKGDKFVSKEYIETKVTKKAHDRIIGYGTKGMPRFEDYQGEVHVKKTLKGCRASAYSGGPNARGASGNPCTYGTMAVDTSVIPMGSLCYVEGYGFAIANDTGSGINGKDIDVFFNQYETACRWGIKYVTVYVLQ
ncbi:MAG: 3D domain-containing protein [Clostridia bacterium]|nr:3D domain-containing protein [Clostridia bacterium]